MPTMKFYNELTGKMERVNSGAIIDDNLKFAPSDIKNIDNKRADLIRKEAHSGFLNNDSTANDFTLGENLLTAKNDLKVNFNGFLVVLPKNTDIALPEPPTFGSRVDMIYLTPTYDGNKSIIGCVANVAEGKSSLAELGFSVDNEDKGLYVSGEDKAIEIAFINRRNSGGYRVDNLNGAREYRAYKGNEAFVNDGSGNTYSGEIRQLTLQSQEIYDYVKVGEGWYYFSGGYFHEILSKDGNLEVTIKAHTAGAILSQHYLYFPISDRPDGKFHNIIHQDDIIDLRHKVTLTDYNYQELLETSFDKVLRGKNETKEKPVLIKERFNLEPAPKNIEPKLMPVKVKGNDGVEREFTNLHGVKGDYSNHTATSTYKEYDRLVLDSGKYYVAIVHEESNFNIWNVFNNETASSIAYKSNVVAGDFVKFTLTAKSTILFRCTNDSNASGKFSLYEVDQETYDKIYVDPAFTGEELAKKFPYVSSYPNVAENLIPSFKDSRWQKHANLTVVGDYEAVLNATNAWQVSRYRVKVKPNQKYNLHVLTDDSNAYYEIDEYSNGSKTNDNLISVTDDTPTTFTTSSTTDELELLLGNSATGTFTFKNPMLVEGSTANPVFIPYGRYYLPQDYADGQIPLRLDMTEQRSIVSDAQSSDIRSDIVEPLKTPQKHITVTQATEGQWSVGDTIKVKSYEGVISGVIDADTGLAKLLSINSTVLTLDSVIGLSVNDTLSLQHPSDPSSFTSLTVMAVDTVNKTITVNGGVSSGWLNGTFYETTASTSSPNVTATGLAGSWSGLGTKEATYTISTAPTDNKTNILLKYSVNYPARKGLKELPQETLSAEVNGQKLVKASDGIVRLKADFAGKVSGNTDLVAHKSFSNHLTSLAGLQTPTKMTNELSTAWYGYMENLGGTYQSAPSTSNVDAQAQQQFSFSLIRLLEDKFGEQYFADCLTVADKVAKAKSTVTKLTANWHGYGSNLLSDNLGKTDFVGKVSGSVVENANIAYHDRMNTSLLPPSGFNNEFTAPYSTADYDDIKTLNDGVMSTFNTLSTSPVGAYAQVMFSFNLIEYVKRKYNLNWTPDVAWLKANITRLIVRWHGYGSSPTGNMANLKVWYNDAWTSPSTNKSHTYNTVSQLDQNSTSATSIVTDDGFMHALAYAEPSDGVTASTINTDFVELEVELKAGGYKANLAPWYVGGGTWYLSHNANHTSGSVTKIGHSFSWLGVEYRIDESGFVHYLAYAEPSNGIAPSTIYTDYIDLEVEVNVAESGYDVFVPENKMPVLSTNLLTQNQAFPVDLQGISQQLSYSSLSIKELGILHVDSSNASSGLYIEADGQFKVGDAVTASFDIKGSGTVDADIYINGQQRMIRKNVILTEDYKKVILPSSITTSGALRVYVRGVANFDMANLKLEKGINTNPVWSEGRKKKTVMNFLGKVAGSTWENPHKAYRKGSSIFDIPSNNKVLEYGQAFYDSDGKSDGTLSTTTNSVSGNYGQVMYEFDLSHLGLSLSELKKALRKMTVKWTGYGVGDNGGVLTHGAQLRSWELGQWSSTSAGATKYNTTDTPSTITMITGSWVTNLITNDQKAYFLVSSTHPAGTASPSEIYTDYISLEVELADYVDFIPANVVKVKSNTKEMKLQYPAKSYRTGVQDRVELWYKHLPIQDLNVLGVNGEVGEVIAYGKGIVTNAKHNEGIGLSATEYVNFMDRFRDFNTMDIANLGKQQPDTLLYALDTTGLNAYFYFGKSTTGVNTYGAYPIIGSEIYYYNDRYRSVDNYHDYFTLPKELRENSGLGFMMPLLVLTGSGELRLYVIYGKTNLANYNKVIYTNSGDIRLASFAIDGKCLLKR